MYDCTLPGAFQNEDQPADNTDIGHLAEGFDDKPDVSSASAEQPATASRIQQPLSPASPKMRLSNHPPATLTPAARAPTSSLAHLFGSNQRSLMKNSGNHPVTAPGKLAAQMHMGASGSKSRQQDQRTARKRFQSDSKHFHIRDQRRPGGMTAVDLATPANRGAPASSPEKQTLRSATDPRGRVSISASIQMLTGSPPSPSPACSRPDVGRTPAITPEAGFGDMHAEARGVASERDWPRKQLDLPPMASSALHTPAAASSAIMHAPKPNRHAHDHSMAAQTPPPAWHSGVKGRDFLASAFKEGMGSAGVREADSLRQGAHVKQQGLEGRMRSILQREQHSASPGGGKAISSAAAHETQRLQEPISIRLAVLEAQREGHMMKARCHICSWQGTDQLLMSCCNGDILSLQSEQQVFAFIQAEVWHAASLAVHDTFDLLQPWSLWQIAGLHDAVILCRHVKRLLL